MVVKRFCVHQNSVADRGLGLLIAYRKLEISQGFNVENKN